MKNLRYKYARSRLKLTPHVANELSLLKWRWLRDNPGKTSFDFKRAHPTYPENMINNCAWCHTSKCEDCALGGIPMADCADGLFHEWVHRTDRRATRAAAGIVKMLEAWKKAHKEEACSFKLR